MERYVIHTNYQYSRSDCKRRCALVEILSRILQYYMIFLLCSFRIYSNFQRNEIIEIDLPQINLSNLYIIIATIERQLNTHNKKRKKSFPIESIFRQFTIFAIVCTKSMAKAKKIAPYRTHHNYLLCSKNVQHFRNATEWQRSGEDEQRAQKRGEQTEMKR